MSSAGTRDSQSPPVGAERGLPVAGELDQPAPRASGRPARRQRPHPDVLAEAGGGGHDPSIGADARAAQPPEMAAQRPDDRLPARVDEGEEAVVAADDEQPAARHVGQGPNRSARDHAEARARPQGPGVDQADRPVAETEGEHPAVGARGRHGEAAARPGVRRAAPDRHRAAEAAVAREVPDEHVAVDAGGVERSAVTTDRQPGDLPRVPLQRLTGRRPLHVPHDHATVLAGGGRRAPVAAEARAHDRAAVAPGGGADLVSPQVEEAHRAIAAAEQQRATVGAHGELPRALRQALDGRSVRASRITVGPRPTLVSSRPSAVTASVTRADPRLT